MIRSLLISLGLGALAAAAPRAPGRARVAPGTAITGRVTSTTGAPLGGASVVVDHTGIGTRTGADGRYALTLPDSLATRETLVLRARFIGYLEARREVRPRAGMVDTVDFRLEASPLRLSETVVTGVGRSSARDESDVSPSPAGGVASAGWGSASVPPPLDARAAAPMPAPLAGALRRADEVVVMTADAPARVDSLARAPRAGAAYAPGSDSPPAAVPSRPTQGTLRARGPDGEIVGEFPLRHTDVSAEVSGFLARTVVEQHYANPFRTTIEAVYVFPLPTLAAVNDFVMEANGRTIVGVVRPRAEAERIYREALARGQTASLLTQERPNIFTQSVANIAPGGEVTIRITYFERLAYEHGEYEWVFPMVVGPRYIPGRPLADAELAADEPTRPSSRGDGWAPNTDVVPDASRITPPALRPGERSGHDISLTVTLDAGLPITRLESVAHRVRVERDAAGRRIVRLAADDAIPNRDFVLRWSVAGPETRIGVLAHRDGDDDGYVTLAIQPPALPRDDQVMPREITFIMDVSGSMMGTPIALSKALVARTLDALRPDDRFNIVYFAAGNAQLWDHARRGTPEHVAEAKRFLENLSAGGGTEMLAGLARALRAPHDDRYLQMYVFLTDGFVGDEARILSMITTERGDARFFGFGIASSVNRYLIDGIGEQGGGESFVVIPRDTAGTERAVSRLFEAIDSPVLADVSIDWNGLPVTDAYPSKLRDLFAGRTIDVIARYTRPASGTAYVTGRLGTRRIRLPVRVTLPTREPAHAALAPAWARWRIADLSSAMLEADPARRESLARAITDVALRYHLVSAYTAFVAVDRSQRVGGGHPRHVTQPVELPEGVRWEGIFGDSLTHTVQAHRSQSIRCGQKPSRTRLSTLVVSPMYANRMSCM